jgi:hypothetical protein
MREKKRKKKKKERRERIGWEEKRGRGIGSKGQPQQKMIAGRKEEEKDKGESEREDWKKKTA